MKKIISILGSTGSVGINTLDVISRFRSDFSVYGLACKSNTDVLFGQIKKFHPEAVCVIDPKKAEELKGKLKKKNIKIYSGLEGLEKITCAGKVGLVVAAMTGKDSLQSILKAIEKRKDIAIANKEIIVGFGDVLMKNAAKKNVRILPIDSEISAIFQCLEGRKKGDIKEIILTASGGPFFGFTPEDIRKVTKKQALEHPVWKMGKKISIDSATLMNKGLEVIETSKYFSISPDKIKVLIHPGSAVHSIVSFIDGTSIAQFSLADMRIPIQLALFYPKKVNTFLPSINLEKTAKLEFFVPDLETFPCLGYAFESLKRAGMMPAILNAANEVAVDAFLGDKIGFADIPKVVKKVTDSMAQTNKGFSQTLNNFIKADFLARQKAKKIIEGKK